VVLVGPLVVAVYCAKRRNLRRSKVVTPVTDSGYEDHVSLEKEIRKLVTPTFYTDQTGDRQVELPVQVAESPGVYANPGTPNPALYANPAASNKLPPLPRRCLSADTVRSLNDTGNRPQSASPSCCTPAERGG
jgi:hypothetical protein